MKKSARVVVQASLSPGRSGEQIRGMDGLFSYLYDEIHRMDSPRYPKTAQLDPEKVARGEKAFNLNCADCHGTHSENGIYYRDPKDFKDPKKGHYVDEIISTKHLQTDETRLKGMNLPYINTVEKTWLGHYGDSNYAFRTRQVLFDYLNKTNLSDAPIREKISQLCEKQTDEDCTYSLTEEMKKKVYGYQVPPLWGIWASAPYLHNGSIPNLRGVLFPQERPKTWKLVDDPLGINTPFTPYNIDNPGLKVEVNLTASPGNTKIYNTESPGCSNSGHDIQDWTQKPAASIKDATKEDILEYLKTL
jgi:mono/diheme cytochrome c family protein